MKFSSLATTVLLFLFAFGQAEADDGRSALSPSLRPLLSSTEGSEMRSLQGTQYMVDYRANFQVILDDECSLPQPKIQVFCLGEITILNTSSVTIMCYEMELSDSDWNRYECANTCSPRSSCKDVYLNSGNPDDKAYAYVDFRCSGDELYKVEGAMLFLGSEGNTCTTTGGGSSRNFHLAQLGILCSDEHDFLAHYQLECNQQAFQEIYRDAYTCYTGYNCDDTCEKDLDDVFINVEVYRLENGCIKTSDGSAVPPFDDNPYIEDHPKGSYTSRFVTEWELDLGMGCDSAAFPVITVECSNGVISDPMPIHSTTQCNIISAKKLQCTDTDPTTFKDMFSGVSYNCTAQDAFPIVKSEFPGTPVSCAQASSNSAKIKMGVNCVDSDTNKIFTYQKDYAFECGADNDFDFDDYGNLICLSTIVHSGGAGEVVIGRTTESTDYTWSNKASTNCYYFQNHTDCECDTITPDPEKTSTPTPEQTAPPVTPGPTVVESRDSGGNSAVAAIVGALTSGLFVAAIVSGIYFYFKWQKRDERPQEEQSPPKWQDAPQQAQRQAQQPVQVQSPYNAQAPSGYPTKNQQNPQIMQPYPQQNQVYSPHHAHSMMQKHQETQQINRTPRSRRGPTVVFSPNVTDITDPTISSDCTFPSQEAIREVPAVRGQLIPTIDYKDQGNSYIHYVNAEPVFDCDV